MAGKDKLEFDVLANDKASKVFDRVSNASKDVGTAVDKAADKGASALKKLVKGAKDAGDAIGKVGGKAKDGLKGLTDGLLKGGPLAMLGIGVGLGAMLVDGFGQALENQDANALLGAQLGSSDAEMKKLGKISGDLYKDAFGDSVSEVNNVMKTVFQSGLASTKDAEEKIKGVTTQVMNYAKISGEEALPITRAISQLLKTGLAKNATEAFDLLTRGTQKGIDKSEDMLDTVNEYSTQFRKLGLTGPAAFGLISQAIQAGARDSDIAADALKEFSIRAVDGSKLTTDSFKALGLSAKTMQGDIASGGPKATAALDLVLDRLRGVKDPAKQSAIAVGLFGTQAEDLGAALYAMDLDTATAEFGNVAGAAKRAGDVINDTASNKLASVGRTIRTSIVDAIGKYALPQLEKFADWFNGPGKMVMVGWAIDGAAALASFGDKTLGVLQAMLGGMAKYGRVALIAAAAGVAVFNPGMAKNMLDQANAIGQWADEAQAGIGGARTELQNWGTTLAKAKTKVELQANIEDLSQKLAKAQKALRDPGLTKERRAQLTADVTRLTRAKDEALRKLNDPGLIKTRTAKLDADKRALDQRLVAARAALADPRLTATKKAKLQATIDQLMAAKARAQGAINALHGKTVNVNIVQRYTSTGVNLTSPSSVGRRASGGPVTKGMPYIVGEKRAELFVPETDGEIVPQVPPKAKGTAYGPTGGGGGGGGVPLVVGSDGTRLGDLLAEVLYVTLRGNGGSVPALRELGF